MLYRIFGLLEFPQLNLTTAWCHTHLYIHLHMYNKKAQIAGNSIYGGSLDSFSINIQFTTTSVKLATLSLDWNILNLELEPNSFSSDPFQVFLCENGIPNYSSSELVRQVYPGELLHFPVLAHSWTKRWNCSCSN